ncbi:peptide deformylase [Lactobacillus amylovorus]|jgi:peptide deformylase|uniref:Peptide deformylase n=1 Tax=Lactobacillus amylovorus TaxID=1604 RepID=A0AAW6BBC5_LACAM|nr:peptide deformylase [Lactobacillus amylovorus]ATO53112.1 peptide deformylase [Lactobacillus amylovorus DSM 20531]KRK42416.1 peptide deformylase [Lactobacillus amylovorus DSM 20531]MCH3997760.1 peptide deformylase [Lactobacillus amylovorus]MCH4139642.1 peptide deformylase [Lactobacillus amylovorus]MCI1531814.1 peptide deformylase [Lactobacillus amylovorus]
MTAQNIIHDQLFLSQKSTSANRADLKVAEDLRDTLLANRDKAVGLAANMIGKNKRIIAFYVGPLPLVMLNPQITKKSGEYLTEEGCLSLSGERKTKRYRTITVTYQDMNLSTKTQEFTDFIAEVIQHEVDHCEGILI